MDAFCELNVESDRRGVRVGRAAGRPLLLLRLPTPETLPPPPAAEEAAAEVGTGDRSASPKRNWSMRWKSWRTRFDAWRSYSHISSVQTLDAPLELAGPLPDRVLAPRPMPMPMRRAS